MMLTLAACWEALSSTISLPFAAIKQAWEDFKFGRYVRKEIARSQARCVDDKQTNGTNDDQGDIKEDRRRRQWRLRRGEEYPWRIERDIKGDLNWRATWILEVKDLHDVEWETRRIHDGRRWRWHSIPQGHWPFPYESSSDKGSDKSTEESRKDE